MTRLEVRCCCDPNKLIGTMPVRDTSMRLISVVLHNMESVHDPAQRMNSERRYEQLVLEICALDMHGYKTLAIKANEIPIEKLRRIPGFVEAK